VVGGENLLFCVIAYFFATLICYSVPSYGMKGLYRKAGSEWFYYQAPKPKGGIRPKAVALKTCDEVDAIRMVLEKEMDGLVLAAEIKDTLEVVLPLYYAAKKDDRKSTRRTRKLVLDSVKDRMGNPRVKDITKQMIADWRSLIVVSGGTLLSNKGLSPTSMTSYLIILRAFLNWCVKENLLRKNPAIDMGRQASVKRTRRMDFLTIEEREKLLGMPGADYLELILHLGFFAGLRIGEMLVCKKEWFYIADDRSHGFLRVEPTVITLDDGRTTTWEPKTNRGVRKIPLHPRLIAFLDRYGFPDPYLLAPQKPLFPCDEKCSLRFDPKRGLAAHAKKCGIAKIGYHMLRHSFATHLAIGGATMAEIAGLLGNTVTVAENSYAGYAARTNNLLPGL